MVRLFYYLSILWILCSSTHSFAWGFYAHRKINRIAVFSLPPEMIGLYKKNIDLITKYATLPDQRRYMVDGEAPRHYLDIDHYGEYPYPELHHNFDSAQAKYSLDTLMEHGIVPWHIQFMYYRLVRAFEDRNTEAIIKTSAELGHYVADACVPLHSSSNHNGQKTGQEGIHALWESRIPELFSEQYFDLFVGHAYFISDISKATWDMFLESAKLSDTVLRKEKEVTDQIGLENKYSIREKGQNLNRSYSTDFVYQYMRSMQNMVQDRMRRAILATASYWFSAWSEAGQPVLDNVQDSLYFNPEEKNIYDNWEAGPGYGRGHE